jgi:IS5 family transposase
MRKVINSQMQIGETDISNIEFDLQSQDEIPQLLMGLQHIYNHKPTRTKVFQILKGIVPKDVDPNNGCPGMDLWKILVLGTLRLNCNWDFDKLHDIANNHKKVRQMLGHNALNDNYRYALQTLKDNISLFTQEVFDEINRIVVNMGHRLLGHQPHEALHGRCDSFVVETNVHYPTDINLLFDAIRKVIKLTGRLCSAIGITTWRKSDYQIRKIKKSFNNVRRMKRSTSNNPDKKAQREKQIIQAHQDYIALVLGALIKLESTLQMLHEHHQDKQQKIQQIEYYKKNAYRQIDQIYRRVVLDETIPPHEKIFSIFEPHTEWISKGKAGVPQELGLRTCVLEDQYGFILYYLVMEQQIDEQVAVPMVVSAKQRFSNLKGCSFDTGFYTPDNKIKLNKILDYVVLPKKGKLSQQDKQLEYSDQFIQKRKKHSAVESAINALENHGLDRCLELFALTYLIFNR